MQTVTWHELVEEPSKLAGVDAIVNLAGESINQRWTDEAKARILGSRVDAAEGLARAVALLEAKPKVVVNASGISAYGFSESETFDESSRTVETDFLASVVRKWEAAADRIPVDRLVKLRVGLVLDREGGAFPKMAMPYRLFGGGPVGSGKQWISWIHLEDMVRLIMFCVDEDRMSGPVNASAPTPVTNDEFGRALGKAMGRPHWFPVPSFLMKAAFGELSALLLEGQRALPRKALDSGFTFRHPTINAAMQAMFTK